MWNFLKPIFGENEVVDSFAYNLRTKVTNPFFGTLIVVWVVHNWELVYTFFTFDKEAGLDFRVTRLKTVADEVFKWSVSDVTFEGFGWNLLLCVFWALLIMVMSLVFLALSKWITGVYQDRVLPNVYRLTSKSKYKTIDEYKALDLSLNSLRAELKKEKEEKVAVESENSELKSKIEEQEDDYNTLLNKKGKEAVSVIIDEIKEYFSSLNSDARRVKSIILIELLKGGSIANLENVEDLEEKGVIEEVFDGIHRFGANQFVLSPIGKMFAKELSKKKDGVTEMV